MSSDNESTNQSQINTSGGAAVGRDVNIRGGDFIGRDQNIFTEETVYTVDGLINPYLGLRAFHYEDRAIYAGREQLAQETVQRLTAPGVQQTLLFITGASGSGKSSFAQAALIPLLESHYAAYQKTVRHAIFRPSSQPLVMLADALQKLHPGEQTRFLPETGFVTHPTQTPPNQINLLLIDQFEELFIQSDASQRAPFCDFLTSLASFADCRTHILITLRVDYLDELFALQPLWAIAKEGVELRTMQPDDLHNAIQKPLQVHHPQKRFAPELLDRLVQDANEDAALLPLLQVTLAELWKTGKLILSNYHSLTDAIRQRADSVYDFSDHASADPKTDRPPDDQLELMSILLDLINVAADGTDRRDARQRRTRQELEQGVAHRPRLIEELVNARLLAAASERRNGEEVEVIDIIHESLIDNWERLRQAIEEQRQQLQRRARFKLWLGEWLRNERQDGYLLLTDMQLAEARALVEGRDIEAQGVEGKEFYQRSLDHYEAERKKELQRAKELAEAQRRRAQTFRHAVVMTGILFLLAALTVGIAFFLRGELAETTIELQNSLTKTQQQLIISRSSQLAAQSDAAVPINYARSLLLAVEAITYTRNFNPPLYVSASITALHNRIEGQPGGIPLHGQNNFVWSVTFSADRRWLASGSLEHMLRVWKVDEWETLPRVLVGHQGAVNSVAFSPDSKWLASGSADKTIRVWEVDKWETPPPVLVGHQGTVNSVAFSTDGKWLASGSADKTIRVWKVGEWAATPVVLYGHEDEVSSVAFSADGKWLASGSWDQTVQIWKVGEWAAAPLIMRVHAQRVTSVAFSADGKSLASGSLNGLWVWQVNDLAAAPIVLYGHEHEISSVAFSADGKWLASGSWDETVRIWQVGKWSAAPLILRGHEDYVLSVAFSPDSRWLVSGSRNFITSEPSIALTDSGDNSIRVWQVGAWAVEPLILQGHKDGISSVAFSPDDKWLASASWDETVRIWQVGKWTPEPVVLQGHKVAFSPDNKWLASASDDKTLQVWQVDRWTILPVIMVGHEGAITSVAFSPDSNWLASGSEDKTIRVWKVGEWTVTPVVLRTNESRIWTVAFSPDSKWLASGGDDKTLQVWRTGEWAEDPVILQSHKSVVESVMFSYDGKWLASGGWDNTVRVWQVNEWLVTPSVLRGHEDFVWSVAFSTDSRWLVSSSGNLISLNGDNSIRLWKVGEWSVAPILLQGHKGRINTIALSSDSEWLVSGGIDKDLRVWVLSPNRLVERACQLAGRNLTLDEWEQYFPNESYRKTCYQWPIHPSVHATITTGTSVSMSMPNISINN